LPDNILFQIFVKLPMKDLDQWRHHFLA